LLASVALVVDLIAAVYVLFATVGAGVHRVDRAEIVAGIDVWAAVDVGALSTHVVGRLRTDSCCETCYKLV
jgi:hypothetical protein